MPLKLAMLGMWHTHADGIVRQVAEHPDEFTPGRLLGPRCRSWSPSAASSGSRGSQTSALFDKPEALLAEPLDGVVVEGRVFENLRLARLALESGRPVLLEKPAGDNLDDFGGSSTWPSGSTCTCR